MAESENKAKQKGALDEFVGSGCLAVVLSVLFEQDRCVYECVCVCVCVCNESRTNRDLA